MNMHVVSNMLSIMVTFKNKGVDIGTLRTIVLSNEGKVYQLNDNGRHMELKWQIDKAIKHPSFGTINLIGEGGNDQCYIAFYLPSFQSWHCIFKHAFV